MKRKVGIAVIHRQIGLPQPWATIAQTVAVLGSRGYWTTLLTAEGTTVAKQRNEMVAHAQRMGLDDLVFVDDDHMISADMVEELLKADGDVVGGLYLTRGEPFNTTAFHWDDDSAKPCISLNADECGLQMPLRVDGLGMGFTRIRLASLEGMDGPIFRLGQICLDEMGEDIDFCRRMGALGRSIYVLPYLKVPHLTVRAVVASADGQVHLVAPHKAVAFANRQRVQPVEA